MDKGNARYDTIILGSGIGGTILAMILARQGYRTLIIEKEHHPRFAIGESVVFRTVMWFWILGHLYDIPEIAYMANLDDIAERVSPNCGFKLTFGFLYHRPGQKQNPAEAHKIIPPLAHFIRESHIYRQDVDAFLVQTAIKYGVEYREQTGVEDIEFDDDGVGVSITGGETIRGRFLVDAAGYRSPIARKMNLRDEPTRAKTQARSIFTHMTGVKPYDLFVDKSEAGPGSTTWHEGTLHHVFDGGWLWVIPFDNHPLTKSKLCSVGLMLDPRKFPQQNDLTPEEEFNQVVSLFPSIEQHLQGAKPARDFVRTGRIQYSSTSTTGPRYCLLSHAGSFIDPIYSRGLIRTLEAIYCLVPRLTKAHDTNNYATEQFAYIDKMQECQFKRTDQLVNNAYRSMAHFDMWNAWQQLWMGNELLNGVYLWRRALKHIQTGDKDYLKGLDEAPKPGMGAPYATTIQALYDRCESLLDLAEDQEITYEEAANRLFAELKACDMLFHPAYNFGDPQTTHVNFVSPVTLAKVIFWGKFKAPPEIRKKLFKLPLATLARIELAGRARPLYAWRKKIISNPTSTITREVFAKTESQPLSTDSVAISEPAL